jgi:hypothetical protein
MALSYAETRNAETLRLLTPAIDAFITRCQQSDNAASTCVRQTLFFFPGGMASRLTRATQKFVEGAAGPFTYEPVWVIPETPVGGARDLAMHRDSVGTFRDKGDRIIIADEALSVAGCSPHDGLIDWAQDNNVDLFVFPWDWRRRLDETVTFFIGTFLPYFRARVQAAGCPDPLASFALIGHSFGGMIVNLILHGNAPILHTMTHAITVATPFYGYSGQVHRWFEGDGMLNCFGLFKQDMMETIASLPGLYTLHYLDEQTFNANETALGGGEYPIPGYPSMDASVVGLRADPYDPQTYGSLVRYPGLTGFDIGELDYAKLQFRTLASPMDSILLQKFHNIRGVKTTNDQVTPVNNTVGRVTWDWITSSFDASDTTPIENDILLPGDGTQPAWTTCLVTNGDRCVTVKAENIDHAFLMNHTGVLETIQEILCPEGAAVSPRETPEPEPASDEEMVDFLQWLSQNRLLIRGVKSFDDREFRKLLPARFSNRLPNLARRFISDVMKRPGPDALRPHGDDAGGREQRSPDTVTAGGPKPAPRPPQRKPSKKKQS